MQAINLRILEKADYRSKEAYKTLRTNIGFCGKDVKVIAFTSCTPNEGKSTVSLHLAASLAEIGKKVIFVDTDLRKSVLVGRYKAGKEIKGLSHYLSGQHPLEDVRYKTNIPMLDVVFAGPVPPNPAELLADTMFEDLIKDLRQEYDYVIIDTPPLGSVIDTAIISKVCDGIILLLAANTISYKFAQEVVAQLKKTNCRILGTVLNKVDMSMNSYYGKYYGKYYGNYGQE